MFHHCCCFLQEGNTALHIAAIHGRSTVAKLLIQNGSDVDIKNKVGEKPLHYINCFVGFNDFFYNFHMN